MATNETSARGRSLADAGGDRRGAADEPGDDPLVDLKRDAAGHAGRAAQMARPTLRAGSDARRQGPDRAGRSAGRTRRGGSATRSRRRIARPHWSEEAREHVSHGGWLGVAETEWREALRASAMAPPDPGFVVRINEIADAAARKAAALDNLGDEAPGDVVGTAVRPGRGRLVVRAAARRRTGRGRQSSVGEVRSGSRRARSRDGRALGPSRAEGAGDGLAEPARNRRRIAPGGRSRVAADGRRAERRRRRSIGEGGGAIRGIARCFVVCCSRR